MRFKMAGFAMHGDRRLRLGPIVKLLQLAPSGVPRHVNESIAVGDDLYFAINKLV